MKFFFPCLFLSALIVLSCNDDDDSGPALQVPDTYEFTRNGQSSVYYGGQTDRLNQTSEIKAYFQKGDKKEIVLDAETLLAMYENAGGDGDGNFSFTSDRQLKDKTFPADVAFFEDLFIDAENASVAGLSAANGTAGYITRKNGSTMLVDANGHEFTQTFEKGIMGSVFLHQIFNVYMTDSRVGDEVENTELDGANNYTPMEHHWDEAFGYWGVPVDFPNNTQNLRFFANYSNGRDPLIGSNKMLMDAFLTGRAAIVAKNYPVKNEQREIIYKGFELVTAATAIHYLNTAKELLGEGESSFGEALHALSEGYMFIRALRISPKKRISDATINEILETHIGENFWELPETDLSGLDEAIDLLVDAFPELANVKDAL
ncbi:MAG TPA: DUF4856 domain-containing protein [Cyclobacteriaceae bacterium]|jgi:hypothetical protein|nr:MAG: DUF4856 domain-containing protein [Bacteroidota bacterium]